jgi:transposase
MTVEIIPDEAHLRLQVITRHNEGWSIHQLSRHYGISRNRVRRIVRKAQKARTQPAAAPPGVAMRTTRTSKLDAFIPNIENLLEKYPTISGVRMMEELRTQGYQGGLSIIRERLKQLRPSPGSEPVIRFETDPGVQAQMDWSPYRIPFSRTGKTDVLCFSYILAFSRRQYIDFTTTRDFHTLIRRHRDAFEYLGGVSMQCLYDSEKTVVLRWEGGQPVFNPHFIDFITHYRCKPIACQRGRPRTKGKVERPFQYIEGNLLNARTFVDIEDLRAIGRWWMREKSDTHIQDTTHRPPQELFIAEEQCRLQPLPTQPYDCCEVVFRVCPNDALIKFETNLYSVPFGHMGEIVSLKATEREIFIYSPYIDLLAHHPRYEKGACRKEESPEHRTCASLRYGVEPVQEAFRCIGEAAPDYLVGLIAKHPRNAGLHARLILQLKERYLTEDINQALQHALAYHAFDAVSIQRILTACASPRTLESLRNEKARTALAQTIPHIKQRSLKEYSTMLNQGDSDEKRSGCSESNQKPLQGAQTADHGENP